MRNQPEPLVPISELYMRSSSLFPAVDAIPYEAADFYRRKYDVQIHLDYRNRECVTLADAYRIRDLRLEAEAELEAQTIAKWHEADLVRAVYQARYDWMQRNDERVRRSVPRNGRETQEWERAMRQEVVRQAIEAEIAAGLPEEAQRSAAIPPLYPFTSISKPPGADDDWYAYKLPKQFAEAARLELEARAKEEAS